LLQSPTYQKHIIGSAMIGSTTGILRYPSAKFRKGHEHYILKTIIAFKVFYKGGNGLIHFGE
jgi:hypothetical protein